MSIVIDVFAVIGFLAVLFSVAFVAMGWWEDRQLDKQFADEDLPPLLRQLKPHVPPQQPHRPELPDRDTPKPPSGPAS